MTRFRWIVSLVFFSSIVGTIGLVQMDAFLMAKVQGPLLPGTAEAPDTETIKCLQQPYHYLGKGHQCFVFLSQDGRHVIKLIDYSRFHVPLAWLLFPHQWLPALQKSIQLHHDRYRVVINGFQLGMQLFPEESCLEYFHIQPGGGLPNLILTDRLHRVNKIDLNHIAFALQKRVTPMFDVFESRLRDHDRAGLKNAIDAYFSLLQKRFIFLIAGVSEHNYGFDGEKCVLMDTGNIYFEPSMQFPDRIEREMSDALKRMKRWFKKHDPESLAYLDENMCRMRERLSLEKRSL